MNLSAFSTTPLYHKRTPRLCERPPERCLDSKYSGGVISIEPLEAWNAWRSSDRRCGR